MLKYGIFKAQTLNKNHMKKINLKTLLQSRAKYTAIAGILLLVGCATAVAVPHVRAISADDEIRTLQDENNNNQNIVAKLRNEAVSYADAITRLQSQINIMQGQINDNQAKQVSLEAQIVEAQAELARQRGVLGEAIKTSYVDGQITTIEMLATSKNLSDFVDKEEYHTAVESKIQSTLVKITKLQNEMKLKKAEIEALLVEQHKQQAQLADSRAEQTRLLTLNQDEQSTFNQKTKENQARIDYLVEQQRAAIQTITPGATYFLRFPGSVRSHNMAVNDYPYANAGFSMSTAPGCNDNDGPDEWGYCTRQCVSYAAWAVQRSGREAPKYYGDAKSWINAARRSGVSVYSTPQPGDVAITTSGPWGHAMYVEQVSGNQILVSQYNAAMNGQYSTQWRTY
jgi:peptidoglycan DL-endopeptidase CwlO